MRQINIHEAKTNLSRLVEEAAEGNPFIIAKAGKPVAMVVPIEAAPAKSRLGFLTGKINVPEQFDRAGDDEILKMFEGEP